MAAKLNKTDRAKYDRLMRKFELDPDGFDRNGNWLTQLDEFAHAMDEKYGEPMREIKGFNKGGMKKKGMAKGGMKKKGYAAGGLKMVEKDGKKVPFYAADGVGKMNKGGMKKKGYAKGGAGMKKKAYAKGGKVAMYNVGGMFKSSTDLKTGVARPKNTYK